MFTVKHIDNAGNLRVKACADVRIEADSGMVWVRAYDDAGKEATFWSGWPSNDRDEDMIYIMNASGSTIHALRFRPSAASALRQSGEGACAAIGGQLAA